MIAEFFLLNRPIVLFVYGLTFFVMGLAIFLQSRRYSRLRLARDLRWLAGFGVLHGLHEWGELFIPLQAAYLPPLFIDVLISLQTVLLAASFACLMWFGSATTEGDWGRLHWLVLGAIVVWSVCYWATLYILPDTRGWHVAANVWARYLLGLPGSMLSAFGLHRLARETVAPLGANHIYQPLRVAGAALLVYAVVGGLIVPASSFPPALWLNKTSFEALTGVPIEVFRSLTGLVLAVSVIRALEIFEIELDEIIRKLEIDQIQGAERNRIGQEIHDGALQGVYSTSLMLETLTPLLTAEPQALGRLQQAQRVLGQVNDDLRAYMATLRSEEAPTTIRDGLRHLTLDPRYRGLVAISLSCDEAVELNAHQTQHVLAIVRESLANTVRHAQAQHVSIAVSRVGAATEVRVHDDGRGFWVDQVERGWGLRAMHDRARLSGGHLTIDSAPGRGTTVIYQAAEPVT